MKHKNSSAPRTRLMVLISHIQSANVRFFPIGNFLGFCCCLILASQIPSVRAKNSSIANCVTKVDGFIVSWSNAFSVYPWMKNGDCVRSGPSCADNLKAIMNKVDGIRSASYNGAAAVLALLPTIGALLGAPTDEIWKLLTILPFGGALATTLSFGGALVPGRIEEYESTISKDIQTKPDFTIRHRRTTVEDNQPEVVEAMKINLLKKLNERLRHPSSLRIPRKDVWFGLFGMVLLLMGSQGAISIIERGAILAWWCDSNWWMHLWYLLVTIAAIIGNFVQSPFTKHYKLFLSDVPYNITVTGGDDLKSKITARNELGNTNSASGTSEDDVIGNTLHHLKTLRAGTVHFGGSPQYTRPRNAVLLLISVAGGSGSKLMSLWRLLSKVFSIAVFVTGTAIFASAQLLATQMGVMGVTPVIAAAVFGRAIASFITASVKETEPMIHVIASSPSQAHHLIAELISHVDDDCGCGDDDGEPGAQEYSRATQIEMNGHILVNGQRVSHRSSLVVNLFGVMARPYNLAKLARKSSIGGLKRFGALQNQDYNSIPLVVPSTRSAVSQNTIANNNSNPAFPI